MPCRFTCFMLGHGIHHALWPERRRGPVSAAAGTASALNGFLMMLVAFLTGGWLGQRDGRHRVAAGLGYRFWCA
jgi:DHA1 family bicyclomycin/chloramphenicol resistance-like MFS transporter